MKKLIPIDQIKMENIDPFKPENQIVDVTFFPELNARVTLYYHYERDSMRVKIEKGSNVLEDTMGGRLTYERTIEQIKGIIKYNREARSE
jgi:hypothetical protein